MFKKILNPILYHGEKKKKNFFEGWYYKIIDRDGKHSFAFIPGIIMGKINETGHSFIQVMDGSNVKADYLKFSKGQFKHNHDPFMIIINNSYFSLTEINLNHYDNNIHIFGSIKIVDVVKWPDSLINPGSMGFYNYLLFMECYSHVCCLDGGIVGELMINKHKYDFTGGKIYIEKNWGKRFPENYLWLQANNFLDKSVALTVSLGRVPLGSFHFNGFLAAFLWKNNVYKFTTINRSKIELCNNHNKIKLSFKKDNYLLNVEAFYKNDEFIKILAPQNGDMVRTVKESITSCIRVEFMDTKKEMMLFQGVSNNAGVEIVGNLVKEKKSL